MSLDRNTALAMMVVSVIMNIVEYTGLMPGLQTAVLSTFYTGVANGVIGALVTTLLFCGVFYCGIQMWMGLIPVALSLFDIFTAIQLQELINYISIDHRDQQREIDQLYSLGWLQFVVVLCIGKVIINIVTIVKAHKAKREIDAGEYQQIP